VITGLGTVNPLALNVSDFWHRMLAGESGVARIARFDCNGYDSQIGGELKGYDGPPEAYVSRREAKRMDAFAQYAVSAASEAVADSGLDFATEDLERCGVAVGSGIGGLQELENQHIRLMEKGPSKVSAFTIPKLMVNAGCGNIAILWGLRGPNLATVTACASAGHALTEGLRIIQRDEADVVLSGGSEAAVTRLGLSSFCALKGLSTRNDDPEHASRPWEKDRDGFLLAEGAGVVVLEELSHATRRGATIYGELLGSGSSCDGYHITAPEPNGKGAALAMSQALHDAELSPEQIEYINAHGTSTVLGDIGETRAVKAVFGEYARKGLMISSTKSFIGHSLGASGGIEMVVVALALRHDIVPPTLNLIAPGDECDLDYVPNTPRQKRVNVAMSNSFGFGGHNVSLVIRRFEG